MHLHACIFEMANRGVETGCFFSREMETAETKNGVGILKNKIQ